MIGLEPTNLSVPNRALYPLSYTPKDCEQGLQTEISRALRVASIYQLMRTVTLRLAFVPWMRIELMTSRFSGVRSTG